MYKKNPKLNDLCTLTLLPGLTVNSIVLQIRHVFQCTQAEKFTLEKLWPM